MPYVALQTLKWGDGWIRPGEAVPENEPGRNYAQLLRLGMIKFVDEAVAPKTAYAEMKVQELKAEAQATGGEDGFEAALKQYHRGFGRYDIPGVGLVQGKEAAIEALRSVQAASE